MAEKLVRDKYPFTPFNDEFPETPMRIAEEVEREGLLIQKLIEEKDKVLKAWLHETPEKLIEELADLVEVCNALAKEVSRGGRASVERARLMKKRERGGFDKGIVIEIAEGEA